MSTTYTPPSRDQLMARMQVTAPKMCLYQPGPTWVEITYSGNSYWIPPDLGGQVVDHPTQIERDREGNATPVQVVADGRLAVGTHYGNVYSKQAKVNPATGRRERVVIGQGPAEGETADAIVIHAIEGWGVRGVVWLEGNDGDEGKIAAARKLYNRWRRDSAEAIVSVRRAFVNTWLSLPTNKGRTAADAPPQTALQREAQEFLDEMNEERRLASAYICVHDGYDTNDREKYLRHMKAAHNETVILDKAERDLTKASDLAETSRLAQEIAKKSRPSA